MQNDNTYNQTIELPLLLQGLQMQLIVRPCYKKSDDPRNDGGLDGLPGEYMVFFVLDRPGFQLYDEYKCDFTPSQKDNFNRGNSHLKIKNFAKDIRDSCVMIDVMNNNRQFAFIGCPNEKGFLSTFKVKLNASSLSDAEQKAYSALSPLLSNYSVFLDIPLYISEIHVTEVRTQTLCMTKINPFREVTISFDIPFEGGYAEEFLFCASLYREALNSNSCNYQYLCFYKIIEIAIRYVKSLNFKAKKSGKPAIDCNERIPKDTHEQINWLNYIYPFKSQWSQKELDIIFLKEAVDKKLNSVIQNQLRPIRVDIAHAFLDSGKLTLLVDEKQHIDRVTRWLPLAKGIARFLLKRGFPDQFSNINFE